MPKVLRATPAAQACQAAGFPSPSERESQGKALTMNRKYLLPFLLLLLVLASFRPAAPGAV